MPSFYIALDNPSIDCYVNGTAISDHESILTKLAKESGLLSIPEYVSQDPQEAIEFMEAEGIPEEDYPILPDEQWFDPDLGLATIESILNKLDACDLDESSTTDIKDELSEWKTVLSNAKDNGHKWHAAVDI